MRFARSFQSDLPLEDMLKRLNEIGPWRWIERDNDNWGPYISAAPTRDAQRAIVKILHEENGFAVDVFFWASYPQEELEEMHRTLFEHLLPAVGARNLATTEIYER